MCGVVGAGFNYEPAASGVRAGWVFGNLNDGGNDGMPCRNSNNGVDTANWNGSLGATGTLKKCKITLHRTILAYVRK